MGRAQNIADEALVALAKAKQARRNAETATLSPNSLQDPSQVIRDMHTRAHELFIEANVLAIAAQIEALGD